MGSNQNSYVDYQISIFGPHPVNYKIRAKDNTSKVSVFSDVLYAEGRLLRDYAGSEIKNTFSLLQNYPNPFNPSTQIRYSIKNDGLVTIKVFDALGKEVSTLLNEYEPAGEYKINFDASSASGGLPSGIYFYTISTGNFNQTKKMILLR